MKKNYNSDSSKPDRKTVERNRRIHMNGLCFKLASLVPNKDMSSQQDRLDHAAFYIKELQDRVEELKKKKQALAGINTDDNRRSNNSVTVGVKLPVLEVTDMDSTLEVVLISSLNKNFMFYRVISILKEEGADVVNATFSRVGDRIFHTIHSQVINSRVGIETSRIFERLKELVS